MSKKTHRNWSIEEVSRMIKIVEEAPSLKIGINAAAIEFKVSQSAISSRYNRTKKGQNTKYLINAVNASAKKSKDRVSNRWTYKEIAKLRKIMKAASSEGEGYKEASEVLGRTPVALNVKWSRLNRGKKKGKKKRKKYTLNPHHISGTKKNPPINIIIDDGGIQNFARCLTFDITDIKVDLVNKKLTIFY